MPTTPPDRRASPTLLALALVLAAAPACQDVLDALKNAQDASGGAGGDLAGGSQRGARRRRRRGGRGAGADDEAPDPAGATTGPAPSALPSAPPAPVAPPTPGSVRLRVTFVDVGQGDGALLESADGHVGMIDAGPPEGSAHLREVLAAHNVTQLDWLVLSHPHLDHIGGAANVINGVRVGAVMDPAYPHPIATYDRLLALIQQRGVPYYRAARGNSFALGGAVSVQVLEPHEPFVSGSRSDVNANSVVLSVTTGNVRVLFMGDAEAETEQRMLQEYPGGLHADVLKVAHHGSRYASSDAFLSAVSPHYAVMSCATGNDYGHPHAETLARLAQHGIAYYRTDLQGDVTLLTDGAQVALSTARQADPSAMAVPGQRGAE